MPFGEIVYLKNPLGAWLLAGATTGVVAAVLLVARRLLGRMVQRIAGRTSRRTDDLAAALVKRTHSLFILALAIYAGSMFLTLAPRLERGIHAVMIVGFLLQVAIWGTVVIALLASWYVERQVGADPAGATTAAAFGFIGRLVLWTVILLLALDNLGIDVTALIAGLGLGGIAVALALQNILRDLFASFSIVLDKPFVIGDFIVVDDLLGTVEHIGLKTTRVRSLSGEQIVLANGDLLQSRIRNYKRMYERRVVFTIGVTYETPHEKVQRIPALLREAVESQKQARFDRAHFKAYGDFALLFEVAYYVTSPDYNVYMDVQQAINLDVLRRFAELGVDFAYPTQTLYLLPHPSPGAASVGSVPPG